MKKQLASYYFLTSLTLHIVIIGIAVFFSNQNSISKNFIVHGAHSSTKSIAIYKKAPTIVPFINLQPKKTNLPTTKKNILNKNIQKKQKPAPIKKKSPPTIHKKQAQKNNNTLKNNNLVKKELSIPKKIPSKQENSKIIEKKDLTTKNLNQKKINTVNKQQKILPIEKKSIKSLPKLEHSPKKTTSQTPNKINEQPLMPIKKEESLNIKKITEKEILKNEVKHQVLPTNNNKKINEEISEKINEDTKEETNNEDNEDNEDEITLDFSASSNEKQDTLLTAVRAEFKRSWHPSVGVPRGTEAIIKLTIDKKGCVEAHYFIKKSNILIYDMSIVRDIKTMRFPDALYNKKICVTLRQ